jgi:[acyl-carrier-protein] S-malonyltransferase
MTIAFVFPGQGSQSLGMLAGLAADQPQIASTFQEASEALDYDLWQLVQTGPEADLNKTEITQPAMLTAGVAVWRVWQAQNGAVPACMAGHSLGEYTALVCAGSLAFGDAVKLVAERGRLMQAAVLPGAGAMAAILGLGEAELADICAAAAEGEVVTCANLNAPGQIVIAGHKAAVDRACAAAKAAGAKRAVPLPVSVPSHCTLMQMAADGLADYLGGIDLHAPTIPVVHNADVDLHPAPAEIADALVRQLSQPVRWIETVQRLARDGVTTIIECGPGKVLTGLCKRIEKDVSCLAVYDPASLQDALSATRGA